MTLAKTAKIPEARKSDLKSPNRKDLEVESLVLLGALGALGALGGLWRSWRENLPEVGLKPDLQALHMAQASA
jgi:hypothetical protein